MVFECKENCGECCFPMMIQNDLFESHKDDMQRGTIGIIPLPLGYILPITKDMRCVFLKPDMKCAIYDEREYACRHFGHRDNPCPYVKPNGEIRTPRGIKMMKTKLSDGSNCRFKRKGIVRDTGFWMEIEINVKFEKVD